MKYVSPVDGEAKVRAFWTSELERENFFQTLAQKKKARILLRAQVSVKERICAEFSGQFVAFLEA